jgi:hypothetical protein
MALAEANPPADPIVAVKVEPEPVMVPEFTVAVIVPPACGFATVTATVWGWGDVPSCGAAKVKEAGTGEITGGALETRLTVVLTELLL